MAIVSAAAETPIHICIHAWSRSVMAPPRDSHGRDRPLTRYTSPTLVQHAAIAKTKMMTRVGTLIVFQY
jgi:hypothetical protein